MDERRLTLIVVPHGDLETRTFEVSYRRLKVGIVMASVLLVIFAFIAATWFPVAAQAGRVPGLERELARLEGERARVAELAQMLAEVEAQYERVRALLGAENPASGTPMLPPLRRDTGRSAVEETSTLGVGLHPLGLVIPRPETPEKDVAVGAGVGPGEKLRPPFGALANR